MRNLLLCLAASLVCATAQADLSIDNFQAGEVVRYPLVIVRGSAAGPEMAIGTSWSTAVRFPVVNHKYVASVELRPGANMLLVHSGTETTKFRLDYKPMTGPYRVEAAYIAAADDPFGTPSPKLDLDMRLLQGLYADAMDRAGYGHKTFQIEWDGASHVGMRLVHSRKTETEFRAIPAELLKEECPVTSEGHCTIGFTTFNFPSKSSIAHLVLSEGSLAIFDAAILAVWPSTLKQSASFLADLSSGLTHLDPCYAAQLNLNPWFQPDGANGSAFDSALPPKISFNGDDVVIDAPYGARVVSAENGTDPAWFVANRTGDPPKRMTLSRKDLRSKMHDTKDPFTIVVVDGHGLRAEIVDRGS